MDEKKSQGNKRLKWKEREEVDQRRGRFPVLIVKSYDEVPKEFAQEILDAMMGMIDTSEIPRQLLENLEGMKNSSRLFHPTECAELSRELGQLLYYRLGKSTQSIERIGYQIELHVGIPNYYTVTILIRALEIVGRKLDPSFCSPRRPTVVIDGNPMIVAYRFHTLENIGKRVVIDPEEYNARSVAFAIPYYCKYFELSELAGGQRCIKLWQWCDPSIFLGSLHKELLGESAQVTYRNRVPQFVIEDKLCFYLVGYCPIRINPNIPSYVFLDSLWIPGMDHTPEFGAYVKKHKLDTVGRARFSKQVGETLTYAGLVKNREFDLIRELHSYVPQVRAIAEQVFDYPGIV